MKKSGIKIDSPQSYSFIALRQCLHELGVDASSVRYRATSSLAHPAGEVSDLNSIDSLQVMDVSLMGLYGTNSPLPTFYTEQIIGNETEELKQFYDLFNHQAISLLYDAWGKYRFTQNASSFTRRLLALCGIDQSQFAVLKYLKMPQLLSIAGLLACRLSSIELLSQAFITLFDDVEITILPLQGTSIDIPVDQLNCLGLNNIKLGESLVLGAEVIDSSEITIGLLLTDPSKLRGWLPGEHDNEMARELIELLLDTPLKYKMNVKVNGPLDNHLPIGLSEYELGWSCYLNGQTGRDSTEHNRITV